MIWYFIFCAFIVFFVAFVRLICLSDIRKLKPSLHPFGYKLIYTDQKIKHSNGVVVSKLLKSEVYGIQGKPDFVYKSVFGGIIPVELKSGKIGNDAMPRFGDMMQLATYFIIIEEVYKKKPKFGNLIYSDYMFKIKNTRAIRKEVIEILGSMNEMLESGQGNAQYDFAKCRYCLCKSVCEFYDRK